ncbi:hypothetical protein NC651_031138 [Populus alba x Populus x berolinensis]|nr:hypothetical protein NC651_031138 [Populus alba x Populus x berolinensis]
MVLQHTLARDIRGTSGTLQLNLYIILQQADKSDEVKGCESVNEMNLWWSRRLSDWEAMVAVQAAAAEEEWGDIMVMQNSEANGYCKTLWDLCFYLLRSPLFLYLVICPTFPSPSTLFRFVLLVSRGLVVVGESSKVPISPSLRVMNSKLGTLVLCERIYINGLPRLKHLNKFPILLSSNSHLRTPVFVDPMLRMCPQEMWEKIDKGGSWVRSMSPFDRKLLDIRIAGVSSETLELLIEEGWFYHFCSTYCFQE